MATSKREARIAITAESSGVDRGVRDAQRKLRAMKREQDKANRAAERQAAKAARGVNSRVGGALTGIGAGLFAAAGFGIAGGLGGALEDVLGYEKELTRFGIDAQLSGDKLAQFSQQVTDTSTKFGVGRQAILEGAHAYQILTGDAEGAIEASKLFAEVSNASGSDMKEIAAVAAGLKQNLKIDPADFRAGFDVLLAMGHKGSIELRDMAGELATLAPLMSQFAGGTGVKGLTELDAAMQVAKKGFADAAETGTGVKSLMVAIEKRSDRLAAKGVKVFDIDPKTGKRTARDFFSIVDSMKKAKLDAKDLIDVLGRSEAMRAALQLISEDGNAAMHDFYNTALASDQVQKDNATYQASTAGKLALAWEHIKNTIAEALTPERIEKFASAMIKVADFLGKSVELLSFLLGGLDKKAGGDAGAVALLGGDKVRSGVDTAKRVLSGETGDGFDEVSHLINESGGVENAKAAARKYLEAQGYVQNKLGFYEPKSAAAAVEQAQQSGDVSDFANASQRLVNQQQMLFAGQLAGKGANDLSGAIVSGISDALAKLQIVVNLDGRKVGTGVANSPANRTPSGKPRG